MFEEVRSLKRRRSIVVRYDAIRCVRPFDLLLMNEEGILRKLSLQGFLWMCEIVRKDGSLEGCRWKDLWILYRGIFFKIVFRKMRIIEEKWVDSDPLSAIASVTSESLHSSPKEAHLLSKRQLVSCGMLEAM